MSSSDLSNDQARKVNEALRPMLGYVSKLKSRMEQIGFPINDKLYMAVVAAYDGLQSATIESHLLSGGKGARRPSSPSWRDRMDGSHRTR